ncbi:MAG: class I SAM-dependent methyltransferase [Acidobacteriota bacterium]
MRGASAPAGSDGSTAGQKVRQVELHRHVAGNYRLRYDAAPSIVFQRFWNAEILSLLPDPIPSPVLDNGCGAGILLCDLAARCDTVYGLDLSAEMLEQARHRAPEVDLREGDLENLPYPDGFFATVVCRGSLHHVPSRQDAVAEINRVLSPGGMLVMTEPSNEFFLVRWARGLLYRCSSKFDQGDRGFTRREIEQLLRGVGLEPVVFKRFGYLSYLISGFPDVLPLILYIPGNVLLTRTLIRIDRFLSKVPGLNICSFHLIGLARKPSVADQRS